MTVSVAMILILAGWLGFICIPLSRFVTSTEDLHLPKPTDTPDSQWDELLHRPGQMDWDLFIYVYLLFYQLSTVALIAAVIVQFSPHAWPRGFWDFFGFATPAVVVPVGLDIWAKQSWSNAAGNKIWISFLTVLAVTWNMGWVVLRNLWDSRQWNRRDKAEKDELRARLSMMYYPVGNSGCPAGNGDEPIPAPAKETWFSRLANLRKSHVSDPKQKPLGLKPTDPHRLWWLFLATGLLSGLYFAGQSFRYVYFATAPHSFLTDLFAVQSFRIVFSLYGKIGMMLVNEKVGIILGPQHQHASPTSTASSSKNNASDPDFDSNASDAPPRADDEEAGCEPARRASFTPQVIRTAMESPIARTIIPAAVLDPTASESIGDLKPSPGPLSLSRIQAASAASAAPSTPELFSYRDFLFAQSVYEGNQLLAQFLTMSAFILSLIILPTINNAVHYPSLTYQLDGADNAHRLVILESTATFIGEVLASALGHWLVWRKTGKVVLIEYARWAASRPRTIFCIFIAAFHILLDSSIMLIQLRYAN
ncbi:hypothetical protein HDU88_004372 [Geranomyces variabilis]|nr:hypothetical protein HDU88_004372 [Geranomyces variabilis]